MTDEINATEDELAATWATGEPGWRRPVLRRIWHARGAVASPADAVRAGATTMKTAIAAIGGVVVGGLLALGAVVLLDDGGSSSDGRDDDAGGTASPSTSMVDRDGDVIVFLDRRITESQQQSIEAWLDAQPQIASYEYWDRAESVAEARRLFRNDSEKMASLDAGVWVPTSYRIRLTRPDLDTAGPIVRYAQTQPGVFRVTVPALVSHSDQLGAQPAVLGVSEVAAMVATVGPPAGRHRAPPPAAPA